MIQASINIFETPPDKDCCSFSAKQTAVVRASDDFYPRDLASHTIHISSVAYNTLFLGEFMQPDWDMFHVSNLYAYDHLISIKLSILKSHT